MDIRIIYCESLESWVKWNTFMDRNGKVLVRINSSEILRAVNGIIKTCLKYIHIEREAFAEETFNEPFHSKHIATVIRS